MQSRLPRLAATGIAVASWLAATPCAALTNWFQPRYTTALPPTYPAYCTCPQTVQYVPQTCYRTQVTSLPVVAYRPVSVIDPCTGCVQTIVQPTTQFVQQVRYIPYQSFRIVSRPTVMAAPVVAAPVVAAPAAVYAPAMPSGCGTCGAGSTLATPAMAAPALGGAPLATPLPQIPTAVAPALDAGTAATFGAPSPAGAVQPAPSLSPVTIRPPTMIDSPSPPSPAVKNTDVDGSQPRSADAGQTESKLKPIPDLKPATKSATDATAAPISAPGLIDPNSRTTMRPVARPADANLASWPAPKTGSDAWRPSHR